MSADIGRTVTFKWNGSEVPGVREKGIAMAGEPVDVTSDEDDGWRTLLTVPTQNEISISISGVTKSPVLRNDFLSGNRTRASEVVFGDGGVMTGTFYLSSYNETGPYQDAVTFEAELLSSGPISYTPPI